ncbi:MAG: agmatine/peptidylarginine deiminase [Aestuariivirga sp.]
MISKRTFLGGVGSLLASPARAMSSAKAAGFRMPLESEPHERTFMQWPAIASIFGSQADLDAVREKIALIASTIARFEPVVLLARPEQADDARAWVKNGVEVWPLEVQDLWCRDSGPTFVVNEAGELAASELGFNGWGGKQPHEDDARVVHRVAEKLNLRIFENGIKGEGGGVEVDGAGTALAHASSWINPNRNAGTREEVETLLLDALGAEKMIWAPGVIGADITDFHIDALARYVKPGQVFIQLPEKIIDGDPWSASAYETYDILKNATDAQGSRLDLVVVPEPLHIRSRAKDFVNSYANYYVCNGAVICAEFGDDKSDEEAARILSQLYPGREIVSLNTDAIGEAGGGIHCSTQQQPLTIT